MRKIDCLRILAVGFIILAIIYFYAFMFAPQFIPSPLKMGLPGRPLNILLVGKDLIYDTDHKVVPNLGNTDVLILIHLDPTRNKVLLYSIPRDTLVNIPGYGQRKINAAFNLGGIKLVKTSIQNLMPVRIDKYLIVNTSLLTNTINLMGGVKLWVDKDMDYDDNAANLHIHLKAGEQKLNGQEAMGFIRYRFDPTGDLARIDRQQRFLKAFFSKLRSLRTLQVAPLILYEVYTNIETDLSLKDAFKIANFLRGMRLSQVKNYTLEGEPLDLPYLGSVWMPKSEEMLQFVKTNL